MNGSVRAQNLARILRIIHLGGPQSRAQLTAETGLNRSTIGELVAELERTGLVVEGTPRAGQVGRPSPVVSAASNVVAIAVNPEVDAVEIAAIGLDRSVRNRKRIPQSGVITASDTAALVAEQLATWQTGDLEHAQVLGVGVAVPGLVRASDGMVRNAPHLHWEDKPVRALIETATGLGTYVENDATLGAHAEHLFGAARDNDDAVYLNGGASGIGGGLVIGGVLARGAGGYAGEFGQNRPGIADPTDRQTANGVLEDEVNRALLLEFMASSSADDAELAAGLARLPEAGPEIARQRRILATALANAVNVVNPAVVVVGGFLAVIAEMDLPAFASDVRRQAMSANAENLQIRVAALGKDRLLIGAAERVFEMSVFATT